MEPDDKVSLIVTYYTPVALSLAVGFTAVRLTKLLDQQWTRVCRNGKYRTLQYAIIAGSAVLLICSAFFLAVNVELPLPRTKYGRDYARYRFNTIRIGDSESDVRSALGQPLSEHQMTIRKRYIYNQLNAYIDFGEFDHVEHINDPRGQVPEFLRGCDSYAVKQTLGSPSSIDIIKGVRLKYSSPFDLHTFSNYWVRNIVLEEENATVYRIESTFAYAY